MKKLKVKDLARQYGVSPKDIEKELAAQGIAVEHDTIAPDMADLVEEHFAELFRAGKKAKSATAEEREITLGAPIIVKNLAEALGRKPPEVITELIKLGELAGMNQPVSEGNARKVCRHWGFTLTLAAAAAPEKPVVPEVVEDPADFVPRPPVVTFLGHVDHGKTSLQDAVRHTRVVAGEAGAITQHIGASTVTHNNRTITFIDTPGHEAFTSMRARGANATDIAILVVSATEGFKVQTVEALNHALAAKVPIIVAINKIDLPDADPDLVLRHMQQNNLFSEDWGGTVGTVRVSAKTGAGLNELLERILLEADMLDLKANPKRPAEGIVLEAEMEAGLGPAASVLIQKGTLRPGDAVVCGDFFGKVRTLISDHGTRLKQAGPSTPVKVVGLSGIPEAGAQLEVFPNEKAARLEAERRVAERRTSQVATSTIATAEDLFSKLQSEARTTLNLVIKSDVKGSGEAIAQSLAKLPSEKVKANIILNNVGSITENDVMLAATSGAIIAGFHVRVNPGVNELAKREKVEIRLYSVIYELLEDITDALTGKLEPEKREKPLGQAKILQIFELNKGPKVCGSIVETGTVRLGAKARVYRKKELIYNGEVQNLRHYQNDVKEMKAGQECGIRLDNFADFLVGDVIDVYEIELKKATL